MSIDQWIKERKSAGTTMISLETMEAKLKTAREEYRNEVRKILDRAGDAHYETTYKNAAVMFNGIHNQVYGN